MASWVDGSGPVGGWVWPSGWVGLAQWVGGGLAQWVGGGLAQWVGEVTFQHVDTHMNAAGFQAISGT